MVRAIFTFVEASASPAVSSLAAIMTDVVVDPPGPTPQPDLRGLAWRSRGLRLLAEEAQGRKFAQICGTGLLA
jgi:hypothetical protein